MDSLRPVPNAAFALLAALGLSGCETLGFYMQAIGGQVALMSSTRPVAELLADPATPPPMSEALKLPSSYSE